MLTRKAFRLSALLATAATLLVSLAARSQVSGCSVSAPALSGTYTIVHAGLTRTYALRIPPTYHPHRPSPVILIFHGWGGDEHEFLDDVTVDNESDRRGYILVAPRGLGSGAPDQRNNSWTFRGSASGLIRERGVAIPICDASVTPEYTYPSCRPARAKNGCSWTQCQDDDVGFVRALLGYLESQFCVDAGHVFAAGGSNGGMFTWELGENPSTAPILRAIAPIIGLPHRGDLRPPGRHAPLPALVITGTMDKTVPPGVWDDANFTTTSDDRDRFYYTGATAIVRRWSEAAGCSTQVTEQRFDVGLNAIECRSYCGALSPAWPPILDCRAPMGHDYDLKQVWPLVLNFFDRQ